jgi:hypothetical protein
MLRTDGYLLPSRKKIGFRIGPKREVIAFTFPTLNQVDKPLQVPSSLFSLQGFAERKTSCPVFTTKSGFRGCIRVKVRARAFHRLFPSKNLSFPAY